MNSRADELEAWVEREGKWVFSRSGGPGGQNVNKVNTKATLRLSISDLPADEEDRQRVRRKLSGRISGSDELVIHAAEARTQRGNRIAAKHRAVALLRAALAHAKKRKPTRPTRNSVERRITAKKIVSRHKRNRKPPDRDSG